MVYHNWFTVPFQTVLGRRPVIPRRMSIFMLATLVAITTHSLTVLIIASAIQDGSGRRKEMAERYRAICTKARNCATPIVC